jgi:hypothetical protein
MKTYKLVSLFILAIVSITACSPEDDIQIPKYNPLIFTEDFNNETFNDGAPEGWTLYAEIGTVAWSQTEYSGDGYAEYTTYQSSDVSSSAWLISPAIDMDKNVGEKLVFQSAQAYVGSAANSLELLISTDFNGTDVASATWDVVNFNTPPLSFDTNFDYFNSGIIDLSAYTGTLYFAFRGKGSGTNTALDGTYQIDNVEIYTTN